MSTATWLDAVAAQIDEVDQDLRAQLRAAWRTREARWTTISLTHQQATTLLRGVMPSAIAATPRRHQHARLAVAMHACAMQLLRLNADPGALRTTIEAPIAAALDLATEAREWVRQARWSQATRAARVNGWRCPSAITTVTRLVTAEHRANAPDLWAGRALRPAATLAIVRQIAVRRAAQLELDLAAPPSAEVVDLRQLPLPLAA